MEENEDGSGVIEVQPEVCTVPSANLGNSQPQTPTSLSSNKEYVVNQFPKDSEFLQQDKVHHDPLFIKGPARKRTSSFDSGKEAPSSKGRNPRRSSVVTIAPGFDAGTEEGEQRDRSGSSSAFGSKRLRYKRTSSFALTPQRSLRRYLTRDVLPHMDNYRHRMSFVKGNFQFKIAKYQFYNSHIV